MPKTVKKDNKKDSAKTKKIIGLCGAGVLVLAVAIGFIFALKNKSNDTSIETGVDANTLSGDARKLTVGADGVEITSGGIYELSDNIESGSVIIRANNADVQLILNSVSITNNDGPAIFVESADNVYVELKGDNTINATPTADYDGAIHSKSDLALTGEGTLTISSTIDGIVGKDDLQIDGGSYTISAQDDGIVGKDSLKITNGSFNISAISGHGLKTSNEEEKGDMEITGGEFKITTGVDGLHSVANILVSGGNIEIAADDDGIHADKATIIDNGAINITKSYEGIEGGEITVNGGDIKVISSDDGFNAAGGSDTGKTQDPFAGDISKVLAINGGTIYVNASGDGLDSNGNVYINGGTTYVDGPINDGNGPMDYGDQGCEFKITGGTLIAVGSSGMAVNATSATQPSVLMNLSGSYSGELSFGGINYTPAKSYSSVLISSPNLSLGSSYTLTISGAEVQTIAINDYLTRTGNAGMMPGMGGDQQGGRQGGAMMPGRR